MNLPNRITLARLFGAFLIFALLGARDAGLLPAAGTDWGVLLLFVLVAGTDWLDGYLARRLNQVTALGRTLDPLVDKVLVCGTLIALLPGHAADLPAGVVVVIVAREFLVSGLRAASEGRGHALGAQLPGKLKMVLQVVLLVALLLSRALGEPRPAFAAALLPLAWLTAAVTLWSAASYVRPALSALEDGKPS